MADYGEHMEDLIYSSVEASVGFQRSPVKISAQSHHLHFLHYL